MECFIDHVNLIWRKPDTVEWSVLSQRSCSGVPRGSVPQHGGRDAASLFVHLGALLLCASAGSGSLSLSEQPPPPPSPVCPSGLTFAVNCLCFLSFFHTPPTFSLQHLCFCAPLLLYRHPLLPPPLCHLCLSPLITWALAVARQKRSGLMVSEDFRALLISTGYSLVLLLAWCCRGSAGPRTSELNLVCLEMTTPSLGRC